MTRSMLRNFVLALAGAVLAAASAQAQDAVRQRVAPGVAGYADELDLIWARPGLSPRDRGLVTITVLIATGKGDRLDSDLERALANGLTPLEASGALTHLAVYAGWPNAETALPAFDRVYAAHGVDTAALAADLPPLPPLESDAAREQAIDAEFGPLAPGFAALSNGVVFDDLWRRSDLTPRDRSLVTIAALAAMGDDDVLAPYLRRGVESGLTREEIGEALSHLALYAGLPKAATGIRALNATLGDPAE